MMRISGGYLFKRLALPAASIITLFSYGFSDDYPAWDFFQTVQINTSESGAGIPENVFNFPLLIRLTPETFSCFSQTSPGGADIRFAKSDGTHLSYQIERWVDNTDDSDTADIWVLIDTVYGDDATRHIIMYWGNSEAADSSDGASVFQNTNGFMAIYHLNDINDASGNGYNAIDQGDAATVSGSGIIGMARYFGGNAFLQPGDLPDRSVGAISFWFNPDQSFNSSSSTTQGIWGKTDNGEYNANLSLRGADFVNGGEGTAGQLQIKVENNNNSYYCNSATSSFTGGDWYHVAWSWDGSSARLFINGVLESSVATSQAVTGQSSDEIGRTWYEQQNIFDGNPRYFTGTIDEFRFDNIDRSDDWFRLCYENQKIEQSLVTFILIGDPPVIVSEPQDITAAVGKDTSLSVTAEGDGEISFKWLRYPSDSIGDAATLVLSPVLPADTGAAFRCVVENEFGTDSSRWATLTVIDTPRIVLQPENETVDSGGTAVFSLEVKDTTQVAYSWYKSGSDEVLSTSRSFTIDEVVSDDSGTYYCLVSNPAAVVSSETVSCTVIPPDPDKPVAKFSVAPKTGYAPLEVTFTDASEGEITSRQWNFGDESVDTVKNPVHVYNEARRYNVTLIVNGPGGSDTLIKIDSVYVTDSTTTAVNSIVIDTAWYDLVSNSIKVFWHIDPEIVGKSPQVGITLSFDPYYLESVEDDTLTMASQYGDATVKPDFPVESDTTCYVALWFRLPGGEWLEPTLKSMIPLLVRTGEQDPDYEVVTYFESGKIKDTVGAFDDKVILWKDEAYTKTETVTDTIELLSLPSLPKGLIPAGLPFEFKSADSSYSFYIGIHVDSLPAGCSLNDVRMYRYIDGAWYVDYGTAIDIIRTMVYVKTGDLRYAFIPMLDTLPPTITLYGTTTAPLTDSVVRHRDSVGIVDNIANARWNYLYGPGNSLPEPADEGNTDTDPNPFSLTIRDTFPEAELRSGLRIMLIADDGCNGDTLLLSRSVRSGVPDFLTTEADRWNPVYASTVLDYPEGDSLVYRLARGNDIDDYNTRFFRLYRWCDYSGNQDRTDKWVEYDPGDQTVQALFRLDPGKMLWLKTYNDATVSLGTGESLPISDTFDVELPPKECTDFGMPLPFGVRMEEIISATGDNGDSIMVYKWKRDSSTGIYTLEPLYVPGMADRQDRAVTVDGVSTDGYSFYNVHSEAVTMRIPPVAEFMTDLSKRSENDVAASDSYTMWSAKFISRSRNGMEQPAVYFGYAPGRSAGQYPLMPTFSPIILSVADSETSKQYGHYIDDDARQGMLKELRISNTGKTSDELEYHFGRTGSFPESYEAYCYDAASGVLKESGSITVASGETVSRMIVIGDASYRQEFLSVVSDRRFQLHSIYPNPFRSAVTVKYSIPFGVEGRISLMVYTIQGKMLWEKNIRDKISAGERTITWNGATRNGLPAGSGIYIIRLVVHDENGKVLRCWRRQATLLR
jgi:PKD repeat protein